MRTILIVIGVIITGIFLPLTVVFLERCLFEDNCSVPWLNTITENPTTLKAPIQLPTTSEEVPISKTPIAESNRQCSKPANFEISYVYRRGNVGQTKTFSHGDVLYSGDSHKLLFKPTDNSFVYIFQIDSSHKIFRLFPSKDLANADSKNHNPVLEDTQYFVPAEQWSFQLGNATGLETIYFVVTCEPDKTLEEQYTTMATMQNNRSIQQRHEARQTWDRSMKSRGLQPKLVTDIKIPQLTWTEDKLDHLTWPEYLKNTCDGCVHIIEFDHQ